MTKYIFLFLTLISCKHPDSEEFNYIENNTSYSKKNSEYKVIGIKDGDTYVLLQNEIEITIRLAHIDCPEKGQPFGKNAKQFASDLCYGNIVTLVTNGKADRNKRLIAEVIVNDINVNKELVRNGAEILSSVKHICRNIFC